MLDMYQITEAFDKYKSSLAYDLLNVAIVLPEDDEETALPPEGKMKMLHRKTSSAL